MKSSKVISMNAITWFGIILIGIPVLILFLVYISDFTEYWCLSRTPTEKKIHNNRVKKIRKYLVEHHDRIIGCFSDGGDYSIDPNYTTSIAFRDLLEKEVKKLFTNVELVEENETLKLRYTTNSTDIPPPPYQVRIK